MTDPAYPDIKNNYAGYLSVNKSSLSALGYIFYGSQKA